MKSKCKIIDCRFLFDAIRNHEKPLWVAGMILGLDVSVEVKYKLGELLLENHYIAFDWLCHKLYGGGNDVD